MIQNCSLEICHLGFNFFALLSHAFPNILSCGKISFPSLNQTESFINFLRLCTDLLVVSYNNNRNNYSFKINFPVVFPCDAKHFHTTVFVLHDVLPGC